MMSETFLRLSVMAIVPCFTKGSFLAGWKVLPQGFDVQHSTPSAEFRLVEYWFSDVRR
jgi:hypothetical protein